MNKKVLPLVENLKERKVDVYAPESYLESNAITENFLLPILESDFEKFVESNQAAINTFLYWKAKIEEIKYRLKPHFTLSLIKNRETKKSIVAKVKWVYEVKGEFKKAPYLTVYIGSLEQYPKGVKDSALYYDAPRKVQEYINRVCPLELPPKK